MDTTAALLLGVHLAATAGMVGLIWFVQVVHYPLFTGVGEDHFVAYEHRHTRQTSLVVGPLMGLEGVTALVIAAVPPDGLSRVLPLVGLALLAVIHTSTITLQVPMHTELGKHYSDAVVRRLVRTNWIRTIGWTMRSVVAVAMLVVASS